MAIFGDFLGPAFAASCMQHVLSDLHSKFTLGAHHVSKSKMVEIQPVAAEIRRRKKERKIEHIERNHRAKI